MQGRPGSGAPPLRPDRERLRRVAELSAGGGRGHANGADGDGGSLVPYSSDAASPHHHHRHRDLIYSTDAAEKAAYASRIRAAAASTRERAAGEFAAVRELLDRVDLSSSSPLQLPPPAPAPPAAAAASGLHHFRRLPPWIDASMAAASTEGLRLLSRLHSEQEARRMLSVRAGIREEKERESSLAGIEEREREVRTAKAAVGRAAARAEKAAAERGAAARKETSARARAEAKAEAAAKAAEAAAEAGAAAAAKARHGGDDEILLLSDSDDEGEKPKPKPKKKPAADDGDGAVLLLSSSDGDDDDDDDDGAKRGGDDLSSAFESGLALAEADEEEDEGHSTADASALSAMAVAAGLPASTASALSRLSPRQRRAALAALSPSGPSGGGAAVVAVQARTGVPLPRSKAASLIGRSWLNDEVINMYVDGLQDRDIAWRRRMQALAAAAGGGGGDGRGGGEDGDGRSSSPPRAHFFSTFFLAKLFSPKRGGEENDGYDYQGVRRWTSPTRLASIYCCARPAKQEADVAARVAAARAAAGVAVRPSGSSSSSSSSFSSFFSTSPPPRLDAPPPCLLTGCDLLVVPVHLGVHWATACVDLGRRRIDYYDSMAGNPGAHLRALQRWLRDEARDKLPSLQPRDNPQGLTPEDFGDWPVRCLDASAVPQQGNGSDCGVFALRFAEALGRGLRAPDLDFSQRDVEGLRLVIAADLVMGTVSATPKRK